MNTNSVLISLMKLWAKSHSDLPQLHHHIIFNTNKLVLAQANTRVRAHTHMHAHTYTHTHTHTHTHA